MAWATASVPAAKAGNSNTPTGPFQNTVAASASLAANSSRVAGPMSTPSRSAGNAVTSNTSVLGIGGELGRADQVDRQHDLHAALGRVGQHLPDLADLVRLQQRPAHLVALRGQEGVGHPAADEHPVGLVRAGWRSPPSLSDGLAPPSTTT